MALSQNRSETYIRSVRLLRINPHSFLIECRHQAVLNTLKACTALCTEAAGVTMYDVHRKSGDLLAQELKQLGFSSNLNRLDMDRLYPHFVSHAVGIDLHESSNGRSQGLVILFAFWLRLRA